MTFYALRTTRDGRELHAFESAHRRDLWCDRFHAPQGTTGHREAVDSTHERVRRLYRDEPTEYIKHPTTGHPVRGFS